MSQELSPRRPRLRHQLLDLDAASAWAARLLRATSGGVWWWAASGVLVLGGAAAGLHAPTAGAWFWHLANGELIHSHGLSGTATYLAQPGAALDLRSWLADLALFFIYSGAGLGGLVVAGAVAGAVVGVGLLLAIRAGGRAHPLVVVVAGGLGLAALAPVLTDLSTELLAILAAALVLALPAVGRGSRLGAAALVVLVIVWTNVQADAGVAVLVIWGWLVIAHWGASRTGQKSAPSWWLIPLTGLALLLSPRGIGAIGELPLSLGMQGEHPLLAAWSSIGFHPWSARVSELAGFVLLFSYWLAGSRLRRADAYLGLVTAALAMLWANYLPWFLVVAAVQSCGYLSLAWWPRESGSQPDHTSRSGSAVLHSRSGLTAAIPLVIALAVLGSGVASIARAGGVSGQTSSQFPVRAARWLADNPTSGAWFTTPGFGDYLSSQFPAGRHLICVDDPLPLAGSALGQCQELAVLNSGALGILRSLHPKLAILPRAAPAATFLRAEGWKIRYRDATTLILAPRNL
ncbi:MAG: hypothetical protein WA751_05355 [Candidatus Dormiibacterota bacterium]